MCVCACCHIVLNQLPLSAHSFILTTKPQASLDSSTTNPPTLANFDHPVTLIANGQCCGSIHYVNTGHCGASVRKLQY